LYSCESETMDVLSSSPFGDPNIQYTFLCFNRNDFVTDTIASPTSIGKNIHYRYHFIPSKDFKLYDHFRLECLEETFYDTDDLYFVGAKCWISSRLCRFSGKTFWKLKMETSLQEKSGCVIYISFDDREALLEYARKISDAPKQFHNMLNRINFSSPFCSMKIDRYFRATSNNVWVDVCCWMLDDKEVFYIVGTEASNGPIPLQSADDGLSVTDRAAPSKALAYLGMTRPEKLAEYSDVEQRMAQRADLVQHEFPTSLIPDWNEFDQELYEYMDNPPVSE
jgi:hypothetical protein